MNSGNHIAECPQNCDCVQCRPEERQSSIDEMISDLTESYRYDSEFSKWEQDFLQSIRDRAESTLSNKQISKLFDIHGKYFG